MPDLSTRRSSTSYERPAAGRSALCGADGGLILSRRRSPEPVDYGFVGDPLPDRFGLDAARMLIDAGYTPVVAPITADAEGEGLLNTNADTVAQTVAVGMSAVYETELVYCFEKRGVLLDVNDDDSVIAEITPEPIRRAPGPGRRGRRHATQAGERLSGDRQPACARSRSARPTGSRRRATGERRCGSE